MSAILSQTPGSLVTVLLQTLNANGAREDGYSIPSVVRVISPDLTESSLYPLDMIRIDTGLFYHRFFLPVGAAALGTYIVDLSYTNLAGDKTIRDYVQVLCTAASGQFSVSPV